MNQTPSPFAADTVNTAGISWHGGAAAFYTPADGEPAFHKAGSEAEIFGRETTMTVQQIRPVPVDRGQEQWYQQSLGIVVFLMYAVMIFRYRDNIVDAVKAMFSSIKTMKIIESPSITLPEYLLNSNIVLLLAAAFYAQQLIIYFGGEGIAVYLGIPVIALYAVYRRVVLNLIKWVSADHDFFDKLTYFNRISLSVSAVFFTPLALAAGSGQAALIVTGIWFGILIIYHLVKIYTFFISEKISNLLWILYLCTVEILPVSYIAITAITANGIY